MHVTNGAPYATTLVTLKSLLGWETGHVVLYDLNSGMHQNCPILVRTRGKNNSGTLQVAGLFQQFWYVLELFEQFWYVRNPLAISLD